MIAAAPGRSPKTMKPRAAAVTGSASVSVAVSPAPMRLRPRAKRVYARAVGRAPRYSASSSPPPVASPPAGTSVSSGSRTAAPMENTDAISASGVAPWSMSVLPATA